MFKNNNYLYSINEQKFICKQFLIKNTYPIKNRFTTNIELILFGAITSDQFDIVELSQF